MGKTSASRPRFIVMISCMAFLSIFFSLFKGSVALPFNQLWTNDQSYLIFELRLSRTFTAFVSGGLLALAGTLMQLLIQNPLADPYVLGISGGAACTALLLMLLGISDDWLITGAWSGSLLTVALILVLAKKHRWQTHPLLLSGIALACGFSALISFILLVSPETTLHSMLFWLTGDINAAQFPWLGLAILSIGFVICLALARGLNILSRGDKEAQVLGLPCKEYRLMLYLLSSLFTATAVTLVGCIGFVGLIIPHLSRMLCGHDYRFILPASVLLGGMLLTAADTLARSLFAPQQIPVGIFMAFIGVPLFIWLLQK